VTGNRVLDEIGTLGQQIRQHGPTATKLLSQGDLEY